MSEFQSPEPQHTVHSRKEDTHNEVGSASLTPPAYSVASGAEDNTSNYTVQRGDTIAAIAAKFGVTVDQVKQGNKVYQYRGRSGRMIPGFQTGQVIKISGAQSNGNSSSTVPSAQKYTVRPGDTISSLANRLGVGQSELIEANKTYQFTTRSGAKTIGFMAGQIITIPITTKGETTAPDVPAKTNIPSTSPEVVNIQEEKTNQPDHEGQTQGNVDIDAFFTSYEERADEILERWYKGKGPENGRDKLTGSMFANAARKIYNEKGDLKYVVPVEFALSQAKLEGGVARNERLGQGNIFNVAAYDSGVSGAEQKINSLEKGFDAYYSFMANSMLDEETPAQLLQPGHFTKGAGTTGGVYATNPVYEGEIKGVIGKMRLQDAGIRLSASVGIGGKNHQADVDIVGSMLVKAGYLNEADAGNATKVGQAILSFQRTELAPQNADWFKRRNNAVTNPKDQENVNIKIGNFNDGVVSNRGLTLGALYYKIAVGGTFGNVAPTQVSTQVDQQDTAPAKESSSAAPAKQQSSETVEGMGAWFSEAWDSIAEYSAEKIEELREWWYEANEKAKDAPSKDNNKPVEQTTEPATGETEQAPLEIVPIQGSVGRGGTNNEADVRMVQMILSQNWGYNISVSGNCDDPTIQAIRRFQHRYAGMTGSQDARVDPNGTTWSFLAGSRTPAVGYSEDGLMGGAETDREEQMAEFVDSYTNIEINIGNGETAHIRPPYHINLDWRMRNALAERRKAPRVNAIIRTLGYGGSDGKATPAQMKSFLETAISQGLVSDTSSQGLYNFLAKYGVSLDCSGLAIQAANYLIEGDMDRSSDGTSETIGIMGTSGIQNQPKVGSPADLQAGDMMVNYRRRGTSTYHVRVITDVDRSGDGIQFSTIESGSSNNLGDGGNGVGQVRWEFPDATKFENLQKLTGNNWARAGRSDQAYTYVRFSQLGDV